MLLDKQVIWTSLLLKAVLTSVENNWGPYYVDRVKAVANGTWNQKDTWHGIGDGMVVISDLDSQMPS